MIVPFTRYNVYSLLQFVTVPATLVNMEERVLRNNLLTIVIVLTTGKETNVRVVSTLMLILIHV